MMLKICLDYSHKTTTYKSGINVAFYMSLAQHFKTLQAKRSEFPALGVMSHTNKTADYDCFCLLS